MSKATEKTEEFAEKLRQKYAGYDVSYSVSGETEIAEIKKPRGVNMRVRLVLSNGILTVTGDAGSAILNLPSSEGLLPMAKQMVEEDYDSDYILSCMMAAEKHVWEKWSPSNAADNAIEYIRESIQTGTFDSNQWIWWVKPVDKFIEDTDDTGCFESRCLWMLWLSTNGLKFFGKDWSSFALNFGDEEPLFISVIKEAMYRIKTELEKK
jgi:hypothetical protein